MKLILHKLFVLVLLSACTPYVGYTHLSDPNISNDGYDLLCGGGEAEKRNITLSVAACRNVASYGGNYIKIDAKYRLKRNP